jgi:hypothetical protein
LAWSSKAKENPVGTEYIIMEKVSGIELERVWPSMNIRDRLALVKALAGFQKAWTSVSFKKFGSLYYAKDLDESAQNEPLYVDPNGIDIIDENFAVGPFMGRESIDNGRATISFNRGPCKISVCKMESLPLITVRALFRGISQCDWSSRNSLRQSTSSTAQVSDNSLWPGNLPTDESEKA